MKNNGLIVTLIILLSIIVFFLVTFLVVYLKGGVNFMNFGSNSTNVIFDDTFNMENIQNIKINQDVGDIIFKETTNDYIQVVLYGDNNDTANVQVIDDRLDINYVIRKKISFFNFGVTKKDIIVYIPKSYSNMITIKNSYGNSEIIDLENATVNIEANCRKCKFR